MLCNLPYYLGLYVSLSVLRIFFCTDAIPECYVKVRSF